MEKSKYAKKGAVKRLREFYLKNRGKASKELIEILNSNTSRDKKSAQSQRNDETGK